jgi:hypothetical protein
MKLSLAFALLFILFLTAVALTAQDVAKNAAPPPTAPVFSETATDHILIAYHKALEAQIQAGIAQTAAKMAANEYLIEVAKQVADAGMPVGTTAQVDVNSDTVTPILPTPSTKKVDKAAKK